MAPFARNVQISAERCQKTNSNVNPIKRFVKCFYYSWIACINILFLYWFSFGREKDFSTVLAIFPVCCFYIKCPRISAGCSQTKIIGKVYLLIIRQKTVIIFIIILVILAFYVKRQYTIRLKLLHTIWCCQHFQQGFQHSDNDFRTFKPPFLPNC